MKQFLLALLVIGSASAFSQSAEKTPGCLDSLYIPNTFTPCGDSANDAFEIHFPCEPDTFKITLFNRWGVEIFSSADHNFRWQAKDTNGVAVSTGVYYYVVEFIYLGEEKTITGNLTVIR